MNACARICALMMAACAFSSAAAGVPKNGTLAPNYVGHHIDGSDALVSQYAGKVVVLTFWATWCGVCHKELPILERLQKVVGTDHLQIIAINIEDKKTFRRVAQLMGTAFLITHDEGESASRLYARGGIPHLVLIGRDGKIIDTHIGYGEDMIDPLIAQINAALAAKPTASVAAPGAPE
ncbi:MAG: TlpA disulfide reductase family protein [Pseudomonadota bacterium]